MNEFNESESFNRGVWRNQWLLAIFELTSIEYQKKTWLDLANTNPHYSFTEFMCFYFDDLLVDIPYPDYVRNGWVNEEEYLIIKKWHELLDNYDAPKNQGAENTAVINDPKWNEIVECGKAVRFKLISIISEEEKAILIDR